MNGWTACFGLWVGLFVLSDGLPFAEKLLVDCQLILKGNHAFIDVISQLQSQFDTF